MTTESQQAFDNRHQVVVFEIWNDGYLQGMKRAEQRIKDRLLSEGMVEKVALAMHPMGFSPEAESAAKASLQAIVDGL